jgi:hypothetical protein
MCRGESGDPEVRGLFPPGVSAEHLGPFDYYYWDDLWGWRGLLDGAFLLDELEERDDAETARSAAKRLEAAIFASLDLVSRRLGRKLIPAGPTRGLDAAMIGSLAAAYPLKLLEATDPWITETAEAIRDQFCIGDAFFQQISHTGLGTYLTLQLAFVELEAGDPRAWRRLRWLLGHATPTFTWPEAIHPRLKGGCMGDGHHGWAAADFLSFVRNLLVRESGDRELALVTVLPDEWMGNELQVSDAPTHFGPVSFTLGWSENHAVLEWEMSSEDVALTLPSVAPGWSSRERGGKVSFPLND